ncbi:MAG: radical SAM protein, partial [Candidatus Bathyarchaeia archaeon]
MNEKNTELAVATEVFLHLLGSPISCALFKLVNMQCLKHRQRIIDYAFNYYMGKNMHKCIICDWLTKVFLLIISEGETAFGIKQETIKRIISDIYYRRGLVSVISGIGRFGITRPFTPFSPFLVVWNYTNACNLRCIHCYQSAVKPLPDELSTRERKIVIDELSEAGVVSIAFSGGEPLMEKDFLEIARYAADKKMYVSLATNGTLITEEMACRLKEAGIQYVEVSLDGANPLTHDSFRNSPNAFELTVRGVRNLVKQGIFTCIATTATRHTLPEIAKIVELSKMLGVRRFLVFNFVPTGRGKDIVDIDLSPTERENLLNFL